MQYLVLHVTLTLCMDGCGDHWGMGGIVSPSKLTIIKLIGLVCKGSSSGSLRECGLKSYEQSSFQYPLWVDGHVTSRFILTLLTSWSYSFLCRLSLNTKIVFWVGFWATLKIISTVSLKHTVEVHWCLYFGVEKGKIYWQTSAYYKNNLAASVQAALALVYKGFIDV